MNMKLKMMIVGVICMATCQLSRAASIAIQSLVDFPIATSFNTLEIEGKQYIPLEAIEQASYHIFRTVEGKTEVLVPSILVDDYKETPFIEVKTPDYRRGTFVELPIKIIDGRRYVAKNFVGPALGVDLTTEPSRSLQHHDERIVLRNVQGRFTVAPKDPIKGKMALIFDPLSNDYERYTDKPLNVNTTFIQSPSWFQLEKEGIISVTASKKDYVSYYKNRGIRVWPLITNQFDADLTHQILKDETHWSDYKNALIANALLYGYDGYNFDFEDVYYEDRNSLTTFVSYLGEELSRVGLYTSMDVTGYSESKNWSRVYDRESLAQGIDYLVLMAYDETWAGSTSAGSVASYPWVEKHLKRLVAEVPHTKILLGVPFYMRNWRETTPYTGDRGNLYDTPMGKVKGTTLSMDAIPSLLKKYQCVPKWDDRGKQEVVRYVDEEGYRHAIWFENNKSLEAKIRLVMAYELAGFAAWRKGFEDPKVWNSIEEALKGRQTVDTLKKDEKKSVKRLGTIHKK